MHQSIAAELRELRDECLNAAERADAMVHAIAYLSVRIALIRATQALGD